MDLLLVIPCYKESGRLPRFLPALAAALENLNCLIQVVDDGSPPADREAVRALVDDVHQRYPKRVAPMLALPVNQGKGAAVRAGWLAHPGSRQVAFVDADGSIAPGEVRRVVELAMANPQKAFFASRVMMLGRRVVRKPYRHYMGRVFATIASIRLQVEAYDTQCGFKILPGAAFYDCAEKFEEDGFAFDLELLVALLDRGYAIEEVPVDWEHVPAGQVRILRDSIAMYVAVGRLVRRRPQWACAGKSPGRPVL